MSIAHQTLSQLINYALALDPDMLPRLAAFDDKVLAITLKPFMIDLYMSFNQHGVQCHPEPPQPPAATIRGSWFALGSLAWRSTSSNPALFGQDVEFSGDVEFAQAIKQVFEQLDIDWEEALAGFVGDPLSHEMSTLFKSLAQTQQRLAQTVTDDFSEFIKDEAKLSPDPKALEVFYQDIAQCRDDVERLQARMNQLINKETLR